MLDQIIADGSFRAEGVYGFWPAHAEGDDIVIGDGARFPMLRQQTPEARRPRPTAAWPTGWRPRATTWAGSRSAIQGADELAARYEADNDDYKAIMVKALADRLAEAFAEWIHLKARREWFEPGAEPAIEELHAEKFRGIRPALGYPATPDHSEKRDLFDLLGAEAAGIALTESFAMTPAAAVSGLILQHPDARYFTVGRLDKDQIHDYAARRGMPVDEVERWLRPNLAYEP